MRDVAEQVLDMIEEVTDVPARQISNSSRFDDLSDCNWTSFQALRLLAAIEDHFGVRLDLREYLSIRDVGGLIAVISGEIG